MSDMELNQLITNLITHASKNNDFDIKEIICHLNIYPNYPIILIGGTNGKGSTCAYLTTILAHAGYQVGGFTSPHVLNYNERFKPAGSEHFHH